MRRGDASIPDKDVTEDLMGKGTFNIQSLYDSFQDNENDDGGIGANNRRCSCHHTGDACSNGGGGGGRRHRDTCKCTHEFREFTETTTLHGLRQIWEKDSVMLRRLLWLCLSLACLGIMLYQILDRVIYYYQWPVTVNVKINFNETLLFPSVTICNQNAFSATAMHDIGQYGLITDIFDDDKPFGVEDLARFNASNLTFEELYKAGGQTKENLILSCKWRDKKCGPENFTTIATDQGLCYSFNYEGDHHMYVNSPGSASGLSLTLNVEEYQYMPGPNDASGIRVLLHNRNQFPNVRALGLILPSGSHAFIGMQMVSVQNLPKPHGQCSSPRLRHFKHYSSENCKLECKARLLKKHCRCRLFYYPDIKGTPFCTLEQYFQCYVPRKAILREETTHQCACAVPCEFHIFDPTISYANRSPLVAERFLAKTNRTCLEERYMMARDVTSRLQKEPWTIMRRLIDQLHNHTTGVRNFLESTIEVKLRFQKRSFMEAHEDIMKVCKEYMSLIQYQKYNVDKNFIRARDAMNERTFSIVALAMQEFVYKLNLTLQQLADPTIKYPSTREVVYLEAMRELMVRKDIITRARSNLTTFVTAMRTGIPIFAYKYKNESKHNNRLIAPMYTFNRYCNDDAGSQSQERGFFGTLNNLIGELSKYEDLINQTFHTSNYSEKALYDVQVRYLQQCRSYLFRKSLYLYALPQTIDEALYRREKALQQLRDQNDVVKLGILTQIQSLTQATSDIKTSLLNVISMGIEEANAFLNDGSVSKITVAETFLKEQVDEAQTSLKNFFSEIRTRGHDLSDLWKEALRLAIEFWKMAIRDPDLQPYYQAKNMSEFLANETDVVDNLTSYYINISASIDLRDDITHLDSDFIKSLGLVVRYMTAFKSTSEIDARFLEKNLLSLNIFYRELNYEQITQQEAYGIFPLLCDIGGSMGLFLGASVLSIFEIFDLFAITYMMGQQRRQNRRET